MPFVTSAMLVITAGKVTLTKSGMESMVDTLGASPDTNRFDACRRICSAATLMSARD